MEKGRQGRDNIFESSDAFGRFGYFGGFGFNRSKMPSLFGGRDPFDDPFFTRPFESIFGPSCTSSDMYQKTSREKGIVIEELDSEDDQEKEDKNSGSTMEPSVEHPDDDVEAEGKSKSVTSRNDHYKIEPPKAGKSSCQTCRVTYSGIDGAYYTSTRSRRIGDDGAVLEESQEADKTTGQATHRISRGIHDKGHSLTRKLDSDGKVDTMQTLHNLDEDELAGFEEAWKGNNINQSRGLHAQAYRSESSSSGDNRGNQIWGGWPLPSLEQRREVRRSAGFGFGNETSSDHGGRTKKVVRINID